MSSITEAPVAVQPSGANRLSRSAHLGIVLAAVLASSPAMADRSDVSARMRHRAIDRCTDDAVRLCPMSLFSERAVVSCLAGQRSKLTPSCRKSYNAVARALRE